MKIYAKEGYSMQNRKNGKIELLRFVLAVIIMISHSANIPGVGSRFFPAGAFAVEFFFIVSGYLMMATIERSLISARSLSTGKETFMFLKKKVVSIYPEIVISWLFSIGVYAVSLDMGLKQIVDQMTKSLGDLLLIKSTGLNLGSVNGVVWYISSMLLVMAILYPLLKKHKDVMLYVVLPVGALIAFGYLCQEAGTMRKPDQWLGTFTRGLPRAFAKISIGVVCYPLAQKLMKSPLSKLGKLALTGIEWAIYITFFLFMYRGQSSKRDYFYVLFLAVGVMITFSGQTIDSKWFNNKICYWLGKFSLPIYLTHAAWCKQLGILMPEGTSIKKLMITYIGISVLSAFVVYFLSMLWRKIQPVLSKISKKLFLKA